MPEVALLHPTERYKEVKTEIWRYIYPESLLFREDVKFCAIFLFSLLHVHFESLYTERNNPYSFNSENKTEVSLRNVFVSQQPNIPLL